MGGAFDIPGKALEAVGADFGFPIVEAEDPEDVIDEVEFVASADGIGGGLGDGLGLLAEFAVPGFGHQVMPGVAVVQAAIAGGSSLAFEGARAGGFLGVGTIGSDLFVGNADECHWDQLRKEVARAAVRLKSRTASFSVLA
jgi:hypothetical protein